MTYLPLNLCFFVSYFPENDLKRSKHVGGLQHVYISFYLIIVQLLVYKIQYLSIRNVNNLIVKIWNLSSYNFLQVSFYPSLLAPNIKQYPASQTVIQ